MKDDKHTPEQLTMEGYLALIGAGPFNEPAYTIWKTFEHHGYVISKKSSTLQSELEQVRKENEELKEEVFQQDAEISTWLSEIKTLKDQERRLRKENEELKRKIELSTKDLNDCDAQVQRQSKEIAELKERLVGAKGVCCGHENETLRQGDGFIYKVCSDCGEEI